MDFNNIDTNLDGRFANAAGRKVVTKKSGEANLRNCNKAQESIGLSIPPTSLQEPASSSSPLSKPWSPSWVTNDDNNLSVPSAPAPAAVQQARVPNTSAPAPVRILPRSGAIGTPGQLHDFSIPKPPSPKNPDVHSIQAQPLKRPPHDVAANDVSLSSLCSSMADERPKKYANYGGMRFEVVRDDKPSRAYPSPLAANPTPAANARDAIGALKRRTRLRPLGYTPPHVEEIRKEYTPFADMKERELRDGVPGAAVEEQNGEGGGEGVKKTVDRVWKWMEEIPEETERGVDWEIVVEREKVDRLWQGKGR